VKYFRDDEFLKRFGLRLRELRKLKNLSQEELAWKAGFELSQVGRIERGEINTSISHLSKLAEVLEVLPKELLDFPG